MIVLHIMHTCIHCFVIWLQIVHLYISQIQYFLKIIHVKSYIIPYTYPMIILSTLFRISGFWSKFLLIKTMNISFCQVLTCVYQIEGPMQFLGWPQCCMGVWKIVILMYSTMLSSASKCCTTCNNIQIYIFI